MRIDNPTAEGLLFRIGVRRDGDAAVVTPTGELDLATVGAVERAVRDARAGGCSSVLLELDGVTFFDSSALRLLFRLDAELSADGCDFAVEPGEGAAARVLTLTRTAQRFGAYARS